MKRQGIALYNRNTQGMNNVVSGKLSKNKHGVLKYPHGDYPIEKYVMISVYEGNLAESIGAMTEASSKMINLMAGKLGEFGRAGENATSKISNKVKDEYTKISQEKNSNYNTGKALTDQNDSEDPQSQAQGPATTQGGVMGDFSNMGGAGWGALTGGLSIMGDTLSNTTKAGFHDVMTAVNRGDLGNGSVNDHAKSFVANIYLPLPNEIQEALSHSYEEEAGWVGTLKEKTPLDAGINAGIGIAAAISKMTGSRSVTFDKNRVSMYTESAFRSISLSWSMVPNNEEESRSIHEIVKSLKKYSSPESVSGKILLKSPHFFRLKFGNKQIDEAMQFYEVVITEIGIDYSPGGNMEMHHDDTPKTLTLSITFKDREPKLMDDWEKGVPKASKPEKPSCSGGGGSNVSTKTDTVTNSPKKAAAGGGSDAKDNSGQKQAPAPESLQEFDHKNDLDNEYVDWQKEKDAVNSIYSDSEANPLVGLSPKIDVAKKLPAETPYAGPSLADYLKG